MHTEAEVRRYRATAVRLDDQIMVAVCDVWLAEQTGQITPATIATMRWLREGVGRSHDLVTVAQCDEWLAHHTAPPIEAARKSPLTTARFWGWFLAILVGIPTVALLITILGAWHLVGACLLAWMISVAIKETIKNGVAEGIKASRETEAK